MVLCSAFVAVTEKAYVYLALNERREKRSSRFVCLAEILFGKQ